MVTRFLGKTHHPAIGIRIPEIVLTGIGRALKKHRTTTGLMLSFGRETAPLAFIRKTLEEIEITLGHTGTSIRQYQSMAAALADELKIPLEVEADHLIVIGSSTAAAKRIAGVYAESPITPEQLEQSLAYNYAAIDEAIDTGAVTAFTTDTSDLFWLEADRLLEAEVLQLFESKFSDVQRHGYQTRYVGKTFRFRNHRNELVTLQLSESSMQRLALKFHASLTENERLYGYIRRHLPRPFGFEISLDETQEKTTLEELFFYLNEWRTRGLPIDYVAPNLGFRKRTDFTASLAALEQVTGEMAAIADHYDGCLLSIHTGSGTTPYSGKGEGTYEALLRATKGKLKYKISGVYYELLMELCAEQPAKSPARLLYEEIYRNVLEYLTHAVETKGALDSPLLREQLAAYRDVVKQDESRRLDPRADFFRYYSYLGLAFRDDKNDRPFRCRLIELYEQDRALKGSIDREVEGLTERLIIGLRFEDNIPRESELR